MTFSEMVEEVYTITKRPDLVAETALAIRKATLQLHQSNFFKDDIATQVFLLPPSSDGYKFQLNTVSDLVRFRAFSFIREWTNPWNESNIFFTEVEPDDLFDEYQIERTDCYYRAGGVINVKSSKRLTAVVVGWYQTPVVIPEASYSSWIATNYPYAVIENAASIIFGIIAQPEQSRTYQGSAMQQLSLIIMNHTEGQGR